MPAPSVSASPAHLPPVSGKTPRRDGEEAGPVVVGVGASAGGLKAITALLAEVPMTSGLSLVVMQHRSPNNEDLLISLLAKATPLPVACAEHGLELKANHVYVAPAGKALGLEQGRFIHTTAAEGDPKLPIDVFFRSLAAERQGTAIAVVLSGSGADGTNGLSAVKENGGLIVVQDPSTAEFDSMPRNAIATGMADYVLAPERIPEALIRYIRQPYVRNMANGVEPSSEDLDRILSLLQASCRRDYRAYKTGTLARRIERRMGIHQIDSMSAYLDFLGTHPAEIEQMSRDILISVTRFFRDPDAFAALDEMILRPLVKRSNGDRPIRVWVPGCATGEEVYSIAILLKEACAAANTTRDIKVFGTDLDLHALDFARAGVYSETIAIDVSEDRLNSFFSRTSTGYKVKSFLRDAVSFAVQNLISDPPFSNLDLISCRNVLIYIDPAVQASIINLFHFGLVDGGGLMLGSAETIGNRTDLFESLSKKLHLYRRLGGGRRLGLSLPASSANMSLETALAPIVTVRNSPADITRQALLLAYAPAAALIDRQFHILYLFGPTGDFLDLPTGEPSQDLTAMMRGDLRLKVRGAVNRVIESNQRITITGIRQKRAGVQGLVTVTVAPIPGPKTANALLLVTFVRETETVAAAADPSQASGEASVVEQLEYELRVTRDDLNGTIQELESSNEALRAANEEVLSINEELQSSNEEMETSKEELQSLNEELSSVNAQLHEKISELETATNDLTNLLTSSDVATLFLSPDLRIKRFTPSATRLFSFIPTDIGRPITDVARHFTDPHLLSDNQRVLDTLTPQEREVEAEGDLLLMRRILPYRTQDNRIEGTVVTFSDVTPLKRTETTLLSRARQQRLVADFGRQALSGEGLPALLHAASAMVAETLGADFVCIFGPSKEQELTLLDGFGWNWQENADRLSPIHPSSHIGHVFWSKQPLIVANFATDRHVRGGTPVPVPDIASGLAVAFGSNAKIPSILALYSRKLGHFGDDDLEFAQAVANVLGLAMARAATLEETRKARDFAEAIVDTVRKPLLVLDGALTVIMASQSYYHMFGTSPAATVGHSLSVLAGGLFHEANLEGILEDALANEGSVESLEISGGHDADGPRTLRIDARQLTRSDRMILVEMEDITESLRTQTMLARAKATAEHASAGKTRFLAAASHDLRQPVQAAVIFHYLLSEMKLEEKASRLLHSLGNTLTVLRSMLDEILDVSRLDAGVVNVQATDFRLDTIFGHLQDEFTQLAQAKALTLRSVGTELVVRSDPKLLERILQNLLANAVKYTDQGRILIGCRRFGDLVRIQIWDTGRGIPAEQLSAIFEEFHQIGNPGRDHSRGLGLGLSIVDRLAQLLGHPISVRSAPGKGSVFEIDVPLAKGRVAPSVDLPFVSLEGEGRSVLVIDDDPAVLESLQLFLIGDGFEVLATTDPSLALELFADKPPPALMIADYRLHGGETGAAAIKRLNDHFGVAVPGILLTGDTSPERIREANSSTLTLLHKPIDPRELATSIRDALIGCGEAAKV
jgi:two-component system, chemotaxis family, CheB/CheR fusion protein